MTHIEESLRQLINKIALENNYEKHEIIINPLSSGGANYSSVLFTAIIREANKEDLHLFAKVAMLGEKIRNEAFEDIFKIERFAYMKLAKIYANLEEENRVPEEHRLFFSKFYGFDPKTHQEILVLENLLPKGYGPFNRFQSIDWEYASSAVADLAKMHALSFAFSKQYPKEFEENCETVLKMKFPEGFMEVVMQNAIETALKHVKPENKTTLQLFLDIYMKHILTNLYKSLRSTVIVHGDFRGSNLMHRVREDGKVDIKILDLQTLQAGSPVSDLIYFIFTGSDEEFRAKYYEKLIDHYYTQLSAAMKRLHLDPEVVFSREDYEYELKEKLPYGLGVAVFTLPVLTVEQENAPEVNESLDLSAITIQKTSDIYPKRLNGVVDDYVRWGYL